MQMAGQQILRKFTSQGKIKTTGRKAHFQRMHYCGRNWERILASYLNSLHGEVVVPALDVQELLDELDPSEIPDGLINLIVQLLENSPADRISITEALHALESM